MRVKKAVLGFAIVSLIAGGLRGQPILSAGAKAPFKLSRTPGGNFLLAESGTGVNDGRVSLLSLWGDRFKLLGGLPSGTGPQGDPLGPTAIGDAHRTIYIVIGEGDVLGQSSNPPKQVPNPNGPASPIFSSIIRARFDPVPDGIRTGFDLTAANIASLADGLEVSLTNPQGEHVSLLLLADFPDTLPDPVLTVRNSNPFAVTVAGSLTSDDLTEFGLSGSVAGANFFARLNPDTPVGRRLEERTKLYLVNVGMNTVSEVSASTGRWKVITRFPPLPNPAFPSIGGPVVDVVPTSVFPRADGTLLVSVLSGFPFVSGNSRVYSVNPATGAFTPFITGLTSATNVIEVAGAVYVLEISSNLLAGEPGRLLRFASPTASPTVVAAGLIGPTGLAHEPTRNELLVSETFTGLIKRIAIAQ